MPSIYDANLPSIRDANAIVRATSNEPAIGFSDRTMMSFVRGDDSRKKFLEKRIPAGSKVVNLGDGSFGIQDESGNVRPIDPAGLDLGDIADFAGDIPEFAGSVGGGLLGAGGGLVTGPGAIGTAVFGAAGGAALGETARQVGSKLLGSEEPFDIGKTAIAAGTGAAGEGIGAGVGMVGRYGLRQLGKALGLAKNAGTPAVEATKEAARKLGVDVSKLPASSMTEAPAVQIAEQYARESPVTAGAIRENVDEPFKAEMEGALGRIREKVGGLPEKKPKEFPAMSGLDRAGVEETLTATVQTARANAKEAVSEAFIRLEEVAPKDTPVTVQHLTNFLKETIGGLEKFPSLNRGVIANMKALQKDLPNVKTLDDMRKLKTLVGELAFDRETFGGSGKAIFANLMQDIESTFYEQLPRLRAVGAAGDDAASRFRTAMDVARREIDLDHSVAVRRVFGGDASEINLEKVDDVASKVFGASKESIRRFAERIGAEGENATPDGMEAYNQLKQVFLDKVLGETAMDPQTLSIAPKRFWDKLFGPRGVGEDKMRVIFGDEETESLKSFARLTMDANVAQNLFANRSNTAIRQEYGKIFDDLFSPTKWVGRFVRNRMAGRLSSTKSEGMLGREFLTTGNVPDQGAMSTGLFGQLARAGLQGAVRTPDRQQPPSMFGTIGRGISPQSGSVVQ